MMARVMVRYLSMNMVRKCMCVVCYCGLIILEEDMYISTIDQFSASITDRNAPKMPSREISAMNAVIIFYFIVLIPSSL